MVTGKIRIPQCWKTLVECELNGDSLDAKWHKKGVDDPTPYYDDDREKCTSLSNGHLFTVFLSSGQGNYWASCDVFSAELDDIVYESEPWETIDDSICFENDNESYCIDVEWY